MMKRNFFILSIFIQGVLITTTYAQNVEDSTCKEALLASVKQMLGDGILLAPDNKLLQYIDFNVYPPNRYLQNHRLLTFFDTRTKFWDDAGFKAEGLVNRECEIIIPREIQKINQLVDVEQKWSTLDIALLYMYFNLNIEGRITFWTTSQYKYCLHKSGLFTIFYGNQDYFSFNAKMLKKECKQLFIDNDSMVQFVLSPMNDFYATGNDTIIKNFSKIYKLVTIYFSSDRHIMLVKKSYFIIRMRSDPKEKRLVFYNDLISLIRAEKLQLPIDPRR